MGAWQPARLSGRSNRVADERRRKAAPIKPGKRGRQGAPHTPAKHVCEEEPLSVTYDLRHAWDRYVPAAATANQPESDLVGVDQVAAMTGRPVPVAPAR